MDRKLKQAIIGFSALGAGALGAYFGVVRPWHLRWGATDEEIQMTLPGDEVKPDAEIQVTHAVTINAPPSEIWKWIVQIGQGRGGFFSYDCIENAFGLEIHNVDKIKPELQNLKVGDFVRSAHENWLGGKYKDLTGWFVVRLEANRALVLRDEIERGSWSFILNPISENQTRLIARARGGKPQNFSLKLFHLSFFEPAHFIMERKMLLTLKQLAEESVRQKVEFTEENLTAQSAAA